MIALALLVVVVGAVLGVRALTPTDGTTAAPTESPKAAKPAKPAIAQPKPFRVVVKGLRGEPIDNAMLFGNRPDTRPPVVKRAGRKAAAALRRYLNAAFVARKTRFTDAPLKPLLTQRAFAMLTPKARAALAARGPKIDGGKSGRAVARGTVLYDHGTPLAVTLRYRAPLRTERNGRTRRLVQRGTMVFIRADGSWQADQVDVELADPRADAKKNAKNKNKQGKKRDADKKRSDRKKKKGSP